jgi:hypothetical protein
MGALRIEQYSGPAREFKNGGQDGSMTMPMPALPLVAAAELLTTSGTSAASAALNDATRAVYLRNTGATSIAVRVGTGTPTALTTDASILASEGRWFGIADSLVGQTIKIAAIDY